MKSVSGIKSNIAWSSSIKSITCAQSLVVIDIEKGSFM